MHADLKRANGSRTADRFATLNGQYLPELDLGMGEYQRWRLVNAIAHAFLNVSLVDRHGAPAACEFWEIGADGVYYETPRAQGAVFVTLGGRKDVIVQARRRAPVSRRAWPVGEGGGSATSAHAALCVGGRAGAPRHALV